MASADLLSGADGFYVADLYARFLHDRSAVDPSWNTFFSELGDDERSLLNELSGPSWAPKPANGGANGHAENGVLAKGETRTNGGAANGAATVPSLGFDQLKIAVRDSIRALMLIRAYRVRGHLLAVLDPLGL